MCPYQTYLHTVSKTTIQLRTVDGPACHIDLDGHRWYVLPDGDFEVIILID